MKNSRKLIPALAMLLVSAVMMSTASLAWFTMNDEVSTNGLHVTAVAPDSIWISQNNSDVWSSTVTLAFEGIDGSHTAPESFIPSTPNSKATYSAWTFNKLSAAASALVLNSGELPVADGTDVLTGVTAEGKVMVDGVILTEGEGEDETEVMAYVPSTSFFRDIIKIKLDAEATKTVPVYVNASVSFDAAALGSRSGIDEIYKAFRVAVVVNGDAVVLEPTSATSDGDIEFAALASDVADNQLISLAGGSTAEVVVYAWVEGSDAQCKNENALNTDAFAIDLYFSINNNDKLPVSSGS